MNIIEARFERLIEHMSIMVLKLLRPLNRDQVIEASGQTIHIILIVPIKPIP